MAISHATDDIAILRPGHVIFSKSFSKGHVIFSESFSKESLHVNLPLCVKFVIEQGSSNRARDGDGSEWGTRIDFGCAGLDHEEIADGVWRPHRLCGGDVFNGVPEEELVQIKACFASVYDCIQVASDETQKFNGRQPLFNYKPRDEVCGAALRDFLGAKVMRNEWCTAQVKCLSRRDQTDRPKDSKNCIWHFCDKTGAFCVVICDAFGDIWSIKFLSNSRHVIDSYFDELLGADTLCSRIKTHFRKLDVACDTFLGEHNGTFKPSSLSWRDPWGFFLTTAASGRAVPPPLDFLRPQRVS
jgi:hypothetical protein